MFVIKAGSIKTESFLDRLDLFAAMSIGMTVPEVPKPEQGASATRDQLSC